MAQPTVYVVKNKRTGLTHTVLEGHYSLDSDEYELISQLNTGPASKTTAETPKTAEVKEEAPKTPAKTTTTKKSAKS